MQLSVIIPAYNEAKRITKTLQVVDIFCSKQSYDYEIIVVNDGSTDETARIVRGLMSSIAHLRLIDNIENQGKGATVRQGMLEAQGQWRLFMDADNSTTIDHLDRFQQAMKDNQVIIGSRRIVGSIIALRQPWYRNFLGGIFRLIVHGIVPLGVKDSQAGFKLFSAQAAAQIFSKQMINGWAFDVEILAIARHLGYTIKEIPITWMNDRESHVRLSGMTRMLIDVLYIRSNLWDNKY